jgi:hypothetical protein
MIMLKTPKNSTGSSSKPTVSIKVGDKTVAAGSTEEVVDKLGKQPEAAKAVNNEHVRGCNEANTEAAAAETKEPEVIEVTPEPEPAANPERHPHLSDTYKFNHVPHDPETVDGEVLSKTVSPDNCASDLRAEPKPDTAPRNWEERDRLTRNGDFTHAEDAVYSYRIVGKDLLDREVTLDAVLNLTKEEQYEVKGRVGRRVGIINNKVGRLNSMSLLDQMFSKEASQLRKDIKEEEKHIDKLMADSRYVSSLRQATQGIEGMANASKLLFG